MTCGSANVSTVAPVAVTIGAGLRSEPGGVCVAFAGPAPETRPAASPMVDAATAVAARARRPFMVPPFGRRPPSCPDRRDRITRTAKSAAMSDHEPFADVLVANEEYARSFALGG